mmetsp:Transcript_18657/g.56334  ORF Transcript_18657/g.56334 Transcript_18657/m.56334 type:complete len:269 (+) Transcript_18657:1-807(+)
MLVRLGCTALAGVLSLLLGARVQLEATLPHVGPLAFPLSVLTGRLASFSLCAREAGGPLPFETLSLEGEHLQLGWKLPALLGAPFWLFFVRERAPVIFLVMLLLVGPPGPKGGQLRFDFLVRESHLRAGAWPTILSVVLSTITRASLPALLVGLQTAETRRLLPDSECTGCSVVGKKLVMDGLVRLGAGRSPLQYTLRTGVLPRRLNVAPDGTELPFPVSTLCWEEPELKLSLGSTGIAALVPPLWVPVRYSWRSCGRSGIWDWFPPT